MKISDIDNTVKLLDLENFFEVYEDIRKMYVYNLNSTIYLKDVPTELFKVEHDMFWTTLSHKIYGTTRAWWLLMKVNGVDVDRTFDSVKAGSQVKYVPQRYLQQLVGIILED